MNTRTLCALLAVTSLTLPRGGGADTPADISGLWLTEADRSLVRVEFDGAEYVAHIVALRHPHFTPEEETGREGEVRIDLKNEDPALRERPLLGLRCLWGFVRDDDEWRQGRLYDPESGKVYRGILTLDGDGILNVRGYIGMPWMGRTIPWRKVTGCDDTTRELLTLSGVEDPVCT